MKDTLFILVQRLLSRNKISYDKNELSFQIQSHPSYPSLHAVTGVLDHFNLENVAAEVPVNSETLEQLPNCFLAQIITDKGNDLVVVERLKKATQYKVFLANKKEEIFTEEEFLKKFTGIIVAVEKTEESAVTSINRSTKNIVFLGVVLVALSAFLVKVDITWHSLIHLTLSVLGIFISYSILKQEQGQETAIGNAFCSGNTEKKDCDAVLSSKGAEIIKGHKLSDLSLVFFSGLFLSSLFLLPHFQEPYLISLLALPITIYSIYYQYAVVKKWCLLCLSIVGVLWLQAIISIPYFDFSFTTIVNYQPWAILVIGFTSVYLVWSYLKPMFTDLNLLKKDKIEFVKFKRNFNLFNSLLQKSPKLNTKLFTKQKEIVLGNTESNLEIVIVTNPFCGHCKPVHKMVNALMEKYQDKVKVVLRFNVPLNDHESKGVVVTTKLLEIYNTKGISNCLEAMDEIYGNIGYDEWLSKWGVTENKNIYIETVKAQKEWCTENAINFTPEILINGKSFPKEYNREDLLFFIEDLEENCCNETVNVSFIE
ncbi:vitamin K epoxide reductase family protein [Tenacibaculum sp. IB213877]|uniref:vitamin K epoxide reductase family protein n=1 Tax=Tenacibaculum sp. IB213877 TaxID=3097351 RepID=UPI002A5A204D|nr:vitamin K epoxide reductase family protein [Tenacibaculum sp. IB213877]MDY0780822.1 vitamin K epoxide reductase family protein [Tenacibaculum sp. IB213877]